MGVDDPSDPALKVGRSALAATKGGKGLRLCDVAAGRRVVGHLQLSDITSAHVEREMPGHGGDDDERIGDDLEKTEFWHANNAAEKQALFPRSIGWNKTKQDRVKVTTSHGRTLFLRFYSDLEDAEKHPARVAGEMETEGTIYKNNAFQWVQTIVRYCGPEQLKQPLPHFGDDSCDELRDFLVVHTNDAETKNNKRFMMRRNMSSGELLNASDHAAAGADGAVQRRAAAQRASSGGVKDDGKPNNNHHRTQSLIDMSPGGAKPDETPRKGGGLSVPAGNDESDGDNGIHF